MATLVMAVSGLFSTSVAAPPTKNVAGSKPNIVWIMADDMGWGEPGLYPSTSVHGRISTPNLDTFGKEGIQFTHAYAGYTVCAPSRTTLFTGRHSGNFPAFHLPGTNLPSNPRVYTDPVTPELLKTAGYVTASIGKVAPLDNPMKFGFDFFIGQVDQGLCHNMYPQMIDTMDSTRNVNLTLNWKMKNRNLTMANPDQYNYTVDITHEQSMAWLKQVANGDKPFFLYESFTVPHAGGWGNAPADPEQGAPVPSDGMYAQHTEWPDVERDHAAVITYLDGYVGELMALIKQLGIDEKTIVFFASDNGAHLEGGHDYKFFNSTGGLLGHKRSLFEGGVRSPTMVRWPGTITPAVSDYSWAFWDFMPTVSELAGVAPPTGIDGISIVPTLMGKEQAPKSYLFWTWAGTGVPPVEGASAVAVTGSKKGPSGYGVRVDDSATGRRWKGVLPHCGNSGKPSTEDPLQLYDIVADPFETSDIASANQEQVKTILKMLMSENVTCACFQC